MGRKTKFRDGWMANLDANGDRVSLYLIETESMYRVRCTWCCSDFDTGSRGFLSVKSHSEKKKHRQVSEFYYFEVSKESEIQVANLKQGRNPVEAVFAGVANQAEDEEAVENMDVVNVADQQLSQGQSQPSQPSQEQTQTQTQRVRTIYPICVSMDSSRNGFEKNRKALVD